MTSSTIKIQAASNGGTTNEDEDWRKHGVAALRFQESKGLISLAQEAMHETCDLGHDLHSAIYGDEPKLTDAQLEQLLCEALTCLETADHYLRMLDSVLEERNGDSPVPWRPTDSPF